MAPGRTPWPPANGDVLHLTADGALAQGGRRGHGERDARPRTQRSRYYYLGQTVPTITHHPTTHPQVSAAVDEPCVTCAAFRMQAAEELRIAGLPELDAHGDADVGLRARDRVPVPQGRWRIAPARLGNERPALPRG